MTKVLIVDDQALVRESVCDLLDIHGEVGEIESASNGIIAMQKIYSFQPDIILLDIQMPKMDGIEVLRAMQRKNISIPVIILTTFDDPKYIYQGIQAGASGYLLKNFDYKKLKSSMDIVLNGGTVLQKEVTQHLIQMLKQPKVNNNTNNLFEPLSSREQDVLKLIARGFSNQKIADKLFLAEGTIKNYVSVILDKLQVKSRVQAVLVAEKNQLI